MTTKTKRPLVEGVHVRARRDSRLRVLEYVVQCRQCEQRIGRVAVENEAMLESLANLSKASHIRNCASKVSGDWYADMGGMHCVWRASEPGSDKGKISARVMKRGVAWRYEINVGQERNCITGYAESEKKAMHAATGHMRSVVAWGR